MKIILAFILSIRLNMMVRSTASIWYGSGAKEIGYGSGKLSAWRLVFSSTRICHMCEQEVGCQQSFVT